MALPTIPDFEAQANLRAEDINTANTEIAQVVGGVVGTTQQLPGLDVANFAASPGFKAKHFLENYAHSSVLLPSWAFLYLPEDIEITSVGLFGTLDPVAPPNDRVKGSLGLVLDGLPVGTFAIASGERDTGSEDLAFGTSVWFRNLSILARAGSIIGFDSSGLKWGDDSVTDPYTVTLHVHLGYKKKLNVGTA